MRVGRRFIQATANPVVGALFLSGRGVAVFGTSASTGTTALLSWNAPSTDESGATATITAYMLYASTSSEDWNLGTFVTPVQTPSNATSYSWQNSAFVASTTWYFWVRAIVTVGGVTAYGAPSQFATKTF